MDQLNLSSKTCNFKIPPYNLQLDSCYLLRATCNLQPATCNLQLAVCYLLLATIVVRRTILTKTNQSLKKLVSFPELGSAQPQLVLTSS